MGPHRRDDRLDRPKLGSDDGFLELFLLLLLLLLPFDDGGGSLGAQPGWSLLRV